MNRDQLLNPDMLLQRDLIITYLTKIVVPHFLVFRRTQMYRNGRNNRCEMSFGGSLPGAGFHRSVLKHGLLCNQC